MKDAERGVPQGKLPVPTGRPGFLAGALLRRLPWAITTSFRQLLHIVLVRYFVALLRYLFSVYLCRRLRFFQPSASVAGNTISHNFKGMVDLAVARSEILVRPLSVIDCIAQDIERVQVLSIGPRTEGELLNLWAYGFRWKNIRGLDLISYSPRIDLGDMHDLPYAADKFDVIILGWVIAYSHDCRRVAQEVIRVARPGAVVALAVEHNPRSDAQIVAEVGYLPGTEHRITQTSEMLSWFEGSVDKIYVRHDVRPERRDRLGAVYVIFSLAK